MGSSMISAEFPVTTKIGVSESGLEQPAWSSAATARGCLGPGFAAVAVTTNCSDTQLAERIAAVASFGLNLRPSLTMTNCYAAVTG